MMKYLSLLLLALQLSASPAIASGSQGSTICNAGTNLNTSALAHESGGNLAAIATSTANIPASPSTSALQTTGNTSLATIATNTNGVATAANQATGNTSLSTLAGAVTGTKIQDNIAQVGGSSFALGQAAGASSLPVALAAPNTMLSSSFSRPANTTAYTAGQTFANSTTAGSVVPLSWAIAPANGVPVYVTKGLFMTQTSGGAGVSIVGTGFRMHLYGQSPTVAAGDGVSFSTSMVNWCGTLDGTVLYQGTDWSVAEMTPTYGSAITCTPGAGSKTIYGLLEARLGFTPTSGEVSQAAITVQ